jgi:plastocyanin
MKRLASRKSGATVVSVGATQPTVDRTVARSAVRPLSAGWLGRTGFAVLLVGLQCGFSLAHAADLPTFPLEMKDGKFTPTRIEVPAGQRIKIAIKNTGTSAAEFESVQLRKEKVLAPGGDSFVVIAPLSPGEYKFFDDFHQATGQGVIVAK